MDGRTEKRTKRLKKRHFQKDNALKRRLNPLHTAISSSLIVTISIAEYTNFYFHYLSKHKQFSVSLRRSFSFLYLQCDFVRL